MLRDQGPARVPVKGGDMGTDAWNQLLLQLAIVTPAVLAATEFLPFGAEGKARRGMAVIYSLLFTFTAYLIGAVTLPRVVPTAFADKLWVDLFVLAVAGFANAAVAMIGHDGYKWVKGKTLKGK